MIHPIAHAPHQGLSTPEVEHSRQLHGSNVLTPPKQEPLWRKFLDKFTDPIIVILLVALFLSLVVACYDYRESGYSDLSHFLEPLGVLVAILLSTGIAFYFEVKSAREFEVLSRVDEETDYKVYRDGQLCLVAKSALVVGDCVLLESGEQVPADGKLLESISLEVDESTLTGEPITSKSVIPLPYEVEEAYPSNRIYRGSMILEGHCVYQVEQVGDATEYGRIYKGVLMNSGVVTPLSLQLEGLARLITRISYGIAAMILLGSVIIYYIDGGFVLWSWSEAVGYFLQKIMIAITIVVVAVPEGLPMSVTLSLAYSMRRMMKTGTLVRSMHACEAIGAATVICTDKTGTLTQNRMSVTEAMFESELPAELLALSLSLNATAHLDTHIAEHPTVLGNPTEGALLLYLWDRGQDYTTLRAEHKVLEQLPFSTERKYMATVTEVGGKRLLLVKGAPEVVVGYTNLSTEAWQRCQQALRSYQARALRTVAFAYKYLEEGEVAFVDHSLTARGLSWAGVVGISDPIRPEVPEAIERCRRAGIEIKIVTGDVSGTAIEIARQMGLWDDSCSVEAHLLTGGEFAQMSDTELLGRVQRLRILCRARPVDKERLVRLLQERGEVVAVTGDGTNDAPALHRAQVGLSMGDGTAVAKEASDITILDNSFASISQAVLWGRSLYLNIQRFLLFQMTINVVACLLVLLGSFLGAESPLTVTQMLWVNLIMDTFASLALASLPPDARVMTQAPRRPDERIITPHMARRILGVGSLMLLFLLALLQYLRHSELMSLRSFTLESVRVDYLNFVRGETSPYELTMFFCVFVLLQFWNLFNAKAYRSRGSALSGLGECRGFLLILVIILVGQIVITTFGGEMFRVVCLSPLTWLALLVATSVVLWMGELGRSIRVTFVPDK